MCFHLLAILLKKNINLIIELIYLLLWAMQKLNYLNLLLNKNNKRFSWII